MATTMSLGGVSLGPDFPLFGRSFEFVRNDDQGTSFRKVKISLGGFLTDENTERVMRLYETLKELATVNDTTFTYTEDDGVSTTLSLYNNHHVWIDSYQEPTDTEHGKVASGDYSIELHYFAPNNDSLGIACSYNGYVFEATPKWHREIQENRETHRARLNGSTATITLTGFLYADNHSALLTKITAMDNAFSADSTLHYGDFSQNVRTVSRSIQEVTMMNFAFFTLTMKYDLGEIVSLRRKIKIPRIHQNPVITEQPFCSRRLIELMNTSSQTITYSLSIEAETISLCRSLLATEAVAIIEPGGLEMPGGEETWDLDRIGVDITIIKFHSNPVILNLIGT